MLDQYTEFKLPKHVMPKIGPKFTKMVMVTQGHSNGTNLFAMMR